MGNRQKRIRRTIFDIMVAAAGLVLLTVCMWNIQTAAAVRHQESNSITKLEIAAQRMAQNAEEADDNITTYDVFNQAKVDTIAWLLARNPDTADLDALCRQWGLTGYALVDTNGKRLKSNLPNFDDASTPFGDALAAMQPVTYTQGTRYYFAEVGDGTFLIAGRDVTAEDTLLARLRSPAYALSTIKVGTTGYIFAVDNETGALAYYPDASLIGHLAVDEGLDPLRFPAGCDGWITLNGERMYLISRDISGYLMAAVVPERELMSDATRVTGLSVAVFAIVMSLLVIYALLLRREQDCQPPCAADFRRIGKLYVNRTVFRKLRSVVLVGLLAVFLATFFMQTLSALSRQSLISETKLASVDTLLDDNQLRVDALVEEYNAEYIGRAQNIAWTIAQDPTIVDDDVLTELAQKADISAIYVFDKRGRTVATNTVFKDFAISTAESEQSYAFWNVIKGYRNELIQPVMQDDTALHNYIQYVGVKRLDADGMVQLGMLPRRMAARLKTTELPYVLSNIAVENNGMLFAVDPASGRFVYYPNTRYIGNDASQYGLSEAALVDGYTGLQTINDVGYFVSTMQWNDTMVCIAVPTSTIYSQRVPTSLWVTLVSFLIIFIMTCFLIFSGKPVEDTAQEKREDTASTQKLARLFRSAGSNRVVQSAASRWNGTRQPWNEKTSEQKLMQITMWMLSVAVLALVIWVWLFDDSLQRGSIIAYILSMKWEKSLNLFSCTYAAVFMLQVLVITTLLRRLLTGLLTRFGARCETIGRLLDSFIKYAAILGVIFYCMSLFGVDSTALITSAGILSLVVGLGAQSLIGDILAGIFIVFEGEFRVGDIVTIGDWRGTVLEIGIRTTKIESAGNDIKIFNNSSISGVINMTKQYSYAYTDVGIEYGESLEHVEAILQKELPVIHEHLPAIVNGPFYKGVVSLGDSSVNIRILAQCQEQDRVQLVRDLNREIKLIFDRHNINIPFPQIVLNQPAEHEQATRSDIRAATAFVKEQKELTRGIHVQENEEAEEHV